MKVGLSTKEKAKMYVKSRRIGVIDHLACVPRVINLRKGRIADRLVFPLSSLDSYVSFNWRWLSYFLTGDGTGFVK